MEESAPSSTIVRPVSSSSQILIRSKTKQKMEKRNIDQNNLEFDQFHQCSSMTILADHDNNVIQQRDLQTILNSNWINDAIIDY